MVTRFHSQPATGCFDGQRMHGSIHLPKGSSLHLLPTLTRSDAQEFVPGVYSWNRAEEPPWSICSSLGMPGSHQGLCPCAQQGPGGQVASKVGPRPLTFQPTTIQLQKEANEALQNSLNKFFCKIMAEMHMAYLGPSVFMSFNLFKAIFLLLDIITVFPIIAAVLKIV